MEKMTADEQAQVAQRAAAMANIAEMVAEHIETTQGRGDGRCESS